MESSPIHLNVLTRPGCRPVNQYQHTEVVCLLLYSRSEFSDRLCLLHWRAGRAGGVTRRLPSRQPCARNRSGVERRSVNSRQRVYYHFHRMPNADCQATTSIHTPEMTSGCYFIIPNFLQMQNFHYTRNS